MVRRLLRRLANYALGPAGLEIVYKGAAEAPPNPWVQGYVSAREVIAAAAAAGVPVSRYVEQKSYRPGHAAQVIETMRALGMLAPPVGDVCEIGTGSGMYAEQILARHPPRRYESYEPNLEWAAWLAAQYHLISHEADGRSLGHTASASIDLVHAHGVFVYLPFLTTYRYFLEIVRVTRPGAAVVFDIMSEECFDDATTARWLQSDWSYPCFLSKQYVIEFFRARGFSCVGEFRTAIDSGTSLYLALRRGRVTFSGADARPSDASAPPSP